MLAMADIGGRGGASDQAQDGLRAGQQACIALARQCLETDRIEFGAALAANQAKLTGCAETAKMMADYETIYQQRTVAMEQGISLFQALADRFVEAGGSAGAMARHAMEWQRRSATLSDLSGRIAALADATPWRGQAGDMYRQRTPEQAQALAEVCAAAAQMESDLELVSQACLQATVEATTCMTMLAADLTGALSLAGGGLSYYRRSAQAVVSLNEANSSLGNTLNGGSWRGLEEAATQQISQTRDSTLPGGYPAIAGGSRQGTGR